MPGRGAPNKRFCPKWLTSTANFFSFTGGVEDLVGFMRKPTKKNGSWVFVDGWYYTLGKTFAQGGAAGAKVAKSLNWVGGVAEATKQVCKALGG